MLLLYERSMVQSHNGVTETSKYFLAFESLSMSPVEAIPAFIDQQWSTLSQHAVCSKARCVQAWSKWLKDVTWFDLKENAALVHKTTSQASKLFHYRGMACTLHQKLNDHGVVLNLHDVHPHDPDFGTSNGIEYDSLKHEKNFIESFVCVWSRDAQWVNPGVEALATNAISLSVGPKSI
jgi:hypothetical protein